MSTYTGAFPPPPEDDPPARAWSPPPTVERAPEPPVVEPPPPPRGRLGTFLLDLDLDVDPDVHPDPVEAADEDAPADDGAPPDDETPAAPVRPFDVIVIDFAGLLVSSPIPAIAALGPSLGIDGLKLLDLVFGPYSSQDSDHAYHRLERNEISTAAYATELTEKAAELGVELDFETLRPHFLGLDVNEVVVEYLIERRKEGYRTALVSNNTKEIALAWKQMLPLGELFDLVVDSSTLGIRKPNPAIFRQTLHQLGGVEPARAVLLDDNLGNVESAKSIGMAGIHVIRDPSQGLRQLDVLLGRRSDHDE